MMKKSDECDYCEGTGSNPRGRSLTENCPECGGSGRAPAGDWRDSLEILELSAAEYKALAAATHYLDAAGNVRPKLVGAK